MKSWEPDFIITLGDNNYRQTETDNIDHNVGRLYSDYIHPYKGAFGKGSPTGTNRFWPAMGNHDWDEPNGYEEYSSYFTLPNDGRYYDMARNARAGRVKASGVLEFDDTGVTINGEDLRFDRGEFVINRSTQTRR